MIRLGFVAEVDQEACSGCGQCVPICPAGAIRMVEETSAVVDEDRCIDCQSCIDRCKKENAISRVTRPSEVLRFVDHTDLDQSQIKTLCAKAGILPHMPVCGCSRTTGQETIAAILKGAETPEDVCARTGLRSGCGIYCATRIFQALEACGIEVENPPDRRWIKLTLGLADVPEEVVERIDQAYPSCCVGEDWKRLTKRRSTSDKKEGSHV
ncbi:MAG: 4Fe-4S binding protein [Desulfomonilaceae bacterium]|nr:4Fe-4S binding protein [Desulfomonilaceae bacterium]